MCHLESQPTQQDPRSRNKLLIETEIDAGIVEVASLPYEIQFSPEHRCNLRCIMCWSTVARNSGIVPLMDRKLPDSTLERFKKLEPGIPLWEWISLTGSGETLLCPAFADILRLLQPHDVIVTFNTNGLLIDREKALLFIETGVDLVTISIDASTKATFEAIRVNGRWEKLLEAIDVLSRAKREAGSELPHLRFCGTFMQRNIEELPGLIDLAAAHGASSVLADCTQIYDPSMQQEALIYHPELTRRVVVEAIRRARRQGIELINQVLVPPEGQEALDAEADLLDEPDPLPEPQGGWRFAAFARALPALLCRRLHLRRAVEEADGSSQPDANIGADQAGPECTDPPAPAAHPGAARSAILQVCQKPWSGLMVWSDGSVRVCCYSELELGNLDHQPIEEIWNSEMAKALRRSFLEGRPPEGCRSCFLFTRTLQEKDSFLHLATRCDWGLEFPGSGEILDGVHTVRGWALHQRGIRRVEVLIDGEVVGEATYGHERSDIAAAFRKYAHHVHCGFLYDLDATGLSDGYHLFSLRITDGDGRGREVAHLTVRAHQQSGVVALP